MTNLAFLIPTLVVLHFVGLSSLLGGFLVQIKDTVAGKGRIVAAMFHGALLQLITGVLLVGVHQMAGDSVNNMKIAVKLAVLIVITVLIIIYRKKATVPSWVNWAIGALTLANVIIAVVW